MKNLLSPRANRIVEIMAVNEARNGFIPEILPEHILLSLLKSGDGLGYAVLQALHINTLTFQLALEQFLAKKSELYRTPPVEYTVSRRLRTFLDLAAIESRSLSNMYIGTEHFVLAGMKEELSASKKFFDDMGISLDLARSVVKEVQLVKPSSVSSNKAGDNQGIQNTASSQSGFVGMQSPSFRADNQSFYRQPNGFQQNQNRGNQNSFLSEFSRDLTALAKEGKLDPVVGRSKEISRVIQILSRRTKNNPILLGEPGVGKTAIAEGLAHKISSGEVPVDLLKKRILSLDLAAMIAGTKYRGEFEERMKKMMKEIKENKNIILFIDELHTIIGAGGPEGSMDASNILKPALSRSEIQIIGATTIKEYRKYFEKDSALERRFQTVKVNEPSSEESIQILEGLKQRYEEFHNVKYDDDVIPAIVKFTTRYIPERFLPDKAIDILDEAGSAKKIIEEDRPIELAELEKSIELLSDEKKTYVASQDYEKAAMIRDKVHDMKIKLDEIKEYWKNNRSAMIKRVTVDDICSIIANITGIPLDQLDKNESKKLLAMENELHKSVIGQDEAVRLLSSTIRRSRAGVSSVHRPMGSFIFLGPTGVGKTQLAKTLAKFLFGSEDALIRIDMSDYMEKHNSSRLVGAPPGYVGYEEGGVLTEKVRQNPYSVVLLDEIEKAHTDVFNLLLQLLEEGQLSDNLGHTVNFRNTVIIMTSNAGARQITSDRKLGFSDVSDGVLPYTEIKASAMEELKRIMSPELINRIDDVVVFNALNREQISSILDIQIGELESRLKEKEISLTIKAKARDYLIDNGYDPSMGARPMRRLIQREIEDPLSVLILEGECEKSHKVVVDYNGSKLTVRFVRQKKLIEVNS